MDDREFAALFEALEPDLRKFVRQFAHKDDVADVVQAAWLKAWRRRHTYRGGGPRVFRSWAFTIAKRVWLDEMRRPHRRVESVGLEDYTDFYVPGNGEEEARQAEWDSTVSTILAALKEPNGRIMKLVVQGCTTAEISLVTGIEEGRVRARIHRIRKELRQKFVRESLLGNG